MQLDYDPFNQEPTSGGYFLGEGYGFLNEYWFDRKQVVRHCQGRLVCFSLYSLPEVQNSSSPVYLLSASLLEAPALDYPFIKEESKAISGLPQHFFESWSKDLRDLLRRAWGGDGHSSSSRLSRPGYELNNPTNRTNLGRIIIEEYKQNFCRLSPLLRTAVEQATNNYQLEPRGKVIPLKFKR